MNPDEKLEIAPATATPVTIYTADYAEPAALGDFVFVYRFDADWVLIEDGTVPA